MFELFYQVPYRQPNSPQNCNPVENSSNHIPLFDIGAIQATTKLLGAGKFLPYNMRKLCIWEFACTTIFQSENYRALARQEGWITTAGNFQTSAEIAYRYLAPNWKFIEDHTALSDAEIETMILAKCFSRKKRIPWDEMGGSWQKAQPKKSVA